MFLLLLMGLGAASVKAQVRIGGNTPPSAAAVLDLNASDAANTGKGGLVLPRVDLTSNTMQLTNGVANQTGTMVYDVTATLGQIGIYYWNGNSWVKASLPSTSQADSGKILMSTGTGIILTTRELSLSNTYRNLRLNTTNPTVYWQLILDTTVFIPLPPLTYQVFTAPGLQATDLCTPNVGNYGLLVTWYDNTFQIMNWRAVTTGTAAERIRCFRASA